jgi:excisionase family DNA binding protein
MKGEPTRFVHFDHTATLRQAPLGNAVPSTSSTVTDSPAVNNATTNVATVEEKIKAHRFLTVHEVAELLQVPVSWVYGRVRERSRDRLPGYRVGKYWWFREREIVAWVQRHRRDAHPA